MTKLRKNDPHDEVVSALQTLAKNYGEPTPSYFNSQLTFIGEIPAPKQRELSRKGFSFSNLPDADKIWDTLWNESQYFQVLSQALLTIEPRQKKFTLNDWKRLKKWVSRIDNWAHSDTISSYYAQLHEQFPKEIYPTFVEWNESKNPWKRRQSIVSLFYYSRSRKTQPKLSLALPLIKNLIKDDHFYVQRGVGWAIRELYNVYPEAAIKLLKKEVRNLAPISWQAATEKLDPTFKKQLLDERRALKVKR